MKKNKFLSLLIISAIATFYSCATKDSLKEDKPQVTQETPSKQPKKKEPEDPPNVKFAKKLQKELENNNISGAIALFDDMPESLKNDLELRLLLGALYYSNKDYTNSIEVANEVLLKDEQNMDALELISMCNYAMGNKKAYKEASNKILELDPYNPNANIQKAEDLVLTKKYKLARESYAKALKGDKTNKDALFGYAQTSYYMNDVVTSKQTFLKILQSDPNNPQANAYLGKLSAEEENYKHAIEYVEKAIQITPDNYDYYLDLGNYYRHLGQYNNAITTWNKAVELEPDYFLAYTYLAGIYDEQNNFDKALENYHNVIKTNPDYFYAYEETAILEYHAKNYENAIKYFLKAYEYSQNYSYRLMVSACFQKLGNKAKAKEALNPVLKTLAKDSVEYQMVRFYYDNYSKNAENALIQKIRNIDNSNKRGKMLFYMGLYYELTGAELPSNEYYVKVTDLQAPMFFEYRLAEWGLNK